MEQLLWTFMIWICGGMGFLMAAGFTALAAGFARAHASASICLMGVGAASIAVFLFYAAGGWYDYFFLHDAWRGPEGWIMGAATAVIAALIVTGAVGERIGLWPFFCFMILFSAFIFPLSTGWSWGGGWLDMHGTSIVHVIAGCAALAGARIIGPRAGRYAPDGRPIPFPGSNIPLAMLGVFFVWGGWFGFNAGNILLHSALPLKALLQEPALLQKMLAQVFMNTALAGAAGCIATLVYVLWKYTKPDPTIVMNGVIAGLVAGSGAPDLFSPFLTVLVAAAGGILCAMTIPVLDKYKIDDPAGVVPVHLVAGIWGTLAAILGTGNFFTQIAGLIIIGGFALGASTAIWLALKNTMGLRCSGRAERHGLDVDQLGMEAYPDFPIRTAGRPDITHIDKY